MGIIFGDVLLGASCLVVFTFWLFYLYLTKNYDYWKNKGVVYVEPEFPFGSMKEIALASTFVGKVHENMYKKFPNEPFYGIIEFQKPNLVLKDPELIKRILVKDFNHFVDRPVVLSNPKEYIMLHLLNLKGQEWKEMRAKLTPTFTSGKMKLMFNLMEKCSDKVREQLENEIGQGKKVDAKNLFARFTLEIIASCAFGVETHSITEKNAEFFRVFGGIMKISTSRHFRRLLVLIFPSFFNIFQVNSVNNNLRDFVTNLVRDTIEYRKKNNIKRNDFLDLLIAVNENKLNTDGTGESNHNSKKGPQSLTLEQMAAQTFVFIIAGFETASSLMAFCLYELSYNQVIQEKLYQDIKATVDKNGGKVSYQALIETRYLDQVINETLRLYGTAHTLSRVCTQPYQVPNTNLTLEKGLKVVIPLFALHHDPKYYPDPYTFDPERFSEEEVKKRHPYVFMPFGQGPRNCIGMRFGLLQAKVGLATIILNFEVQALQDRDNPIEIDKRSPAITPAQPVLVNFKKRNSLQIL